MDGAKILKWHSATFYKKRNNATMNFYAIFDLLIILIAEQLP
ncbi:hypothetical protein [Heyndrickxia ginsengihumi]